MEDLKNVLTESLEYYLEQERIIASRMAQLPKGRIREKKIGNNTYYYLQHRKGKKMIDDYIGKTIPEKLRDNLQQREKLSKELQKVREALSLLNRNQKSAIDFSPPLHQLLSRMTEHNLWDSGIEIIGSWCFLIYQKYLPLGSYPMRTQDLDILIPFPYRGKTFDFATFFRELGFEERFHPDGSIFFSTSGLKIEFLAPGKISRMKPPARVKELSVNPQFLQFVSMLLDDSIEIRIAKDLKVKLPAPGTFFLHKLLISTRPLRREKQKKDLHQAIHIGRYLLSHDRERKQLKRRWKTLSGSWQKKILKALGTAEAKIPLE